MLFRSHLFRPANAAILAFLVSACAGTTRDAGPGAGVAGSCAAPLKPAIEHQVYFGRALAKGGEVSEAQWSRFVSDIVTPRFPDGLSVLNVAGQSRSSPSNQPLREHTKLLVVVVPAALAAQSSARIDEIGAEYRKRFAQRAVFHVDRPVCASL